MQVSEGPEDCQDGSNCTCSGLTADGQTSFLSLNVLGPSVLTFHWRSSSEAQHDTGTVTVDGKSALLSISGVTQWQEASVTLPNPYLHNV